MSEHLELAAALDHARDRLQAEAPVPAPDYLTVQEVADLARCEHKAVRRAIAAGELEAFRPAHKLLIREDRARAWIEARPVYAPTSRPAPARRSRRSARPSVAGSVASLRELERDATMGRT